MKKIISLTLLMLLLGTMVFGFTLAQDTPQLEGFSTTNINVRSGPGTEYDVRTTLQTGYEVTVIGRTTAAGTNEECLLDEGLNLDTGWLLIEYVGIPGWVTRCAIRVEGDLSVVPVITIVPEVTPEAAAESTEEPEVQEVTCLAPVETDQLEFPTGSTRIVSNIRMEPDIDAEVIRNFRGRVSIIGESEDSGWYKIRYRQRYLRYDGRRRIYLTCEGWIARHLITNLQFR